MARSYDHIDSDARYRYLMRAHKAPSGTIERLRLLIYIMPKSHATFLFDLECVTQEQEFIKRNKLSPPFAFCPISLLQERWSPKQQSNHLKYLRDRGFVRVTRFTGKRWVSINLIAINKAIDIVEGSKS